MEKDNSTTAAATTDVTLNNTKTTITFLTPRFLDVVYQNFKPEPNIKYKFHGYFEILNWRSLQETYPTSRAWFTHVYRFSHLNGFVR